MSLLNPETFLDIVQRAQQRAQIASLTSTVVDQSGQSLDFVLWANEAWTKLQELRDNWGWMIVRPGVSFQTQSAKVYYTPTEAGVPDDDVRMWIKDSFRVYLTSAGQNSEVYLKWETYETFRDVYQIGALRTAPVSPVVFTITPELHLGIQTPAVGYTITGDYYRIVKGFPGADSDVPTGLPNWGIMALVYRTVMFYAAAENDGTMYNEAEKEYNAIVHRLLRQYTPQIWAGGPLA